MADKAELVPAYDRAMFPNLLDQDPRAVMDRFAARFSAAETLDDLFNVLEGKTSDDMIGRVVTIHSVAWAPFESDRGTIPLAVCQASDKSTGEVFEFATTGEVLTLFIRKAELIGALPFTARIEGKRTSNGQTALNFARA